MEKVNEVSVEFILALANLVPDAFDADVLEVDLLGVVALDPLLKFYQLLQLQLPLLLEPSLRLARPLALSLPLPPTLLLIGLLLYPTVESGQLWHAGLLPY